MLNTISRRLPLVEVTLAPVPVQGEEAPMAIVEALRSVNQVVQPEVILLARGGGSIEDLWAFNDERVVRAITQSTAPVITGVGHETDFTLADFAADLRAPTPTAAAELATPITVLDLKSSLAEIQRILISTTATLLQRERETLGWTNTRLRMYSPLRRLQTERQRLDELSRRITFAQSHQLELAAERLKGLENRLIALNPMAVLARGYAVVMKDSKVVTSKSEVKKGDPLHVRVQDGEFDAQVTGTDR
jgi:exodeoxyribonuclease VII large subunit